MKLFNSFSFAILFLLLVLGSASVYTINEGQHAVLLRLGRIEVDSQTKLPVVNGPGLHFKIPFLNQARLFDTRIQTLDIESSRIVTAEKKDVLVDYYAKWRIMDLALYYTRTGGVPIQAETLLRQRLNDGLRAEFGKRDISEVVSGERSDIMAILKQQANDSTSKGLGIEIVDVRIKRIDLPTEVSNAVYDRMRAERERVATEHRADGKSVAESTRANADAKVTVILATADSNSKRIRGEGDAEAAKIYADAYNQNPSFYAFYRSMQAYKKAFHSQQDVLLLKPDSHFFKYFNQAGNSKA